MHRPGRRARLEANSFEVFLAFLALLSGVFYFLLPDPGDAPLGSVVHPWDYVWAAAIALSGAGIIGGLYRGRADVEAGSLVVLCTCALIQAAALYAQRGPVALPNVFVFLSLVWCAAIRVRLILIYKSPQGVREEQL